MNINGLTNKVDILTCIKENIEAGNKDTAVDMLAELIREESIEAVANDPKVFESDPMPFPDARDHHLINQNFNKATGGK